MRASEIVCAEDDYSYGRSSNKMIFGWLVDFINHFGRLNGFKLILDRFKKGPKLSIQVIAALLKLRQPVFSLNPTKIFSFLFCFLPTRRPWGFCFEYLTPQTVKAYFLEIIELVPKFFENLSDEDIKKECKSETKNDSISTVIKWLKHLANRIPDQNELCKNLEQLRFKIILK
jgi:ubiquitin carboxyl-terminal hydrolase 9/24